MSVVISFTSRQCAYGGGVGNRTRVQPVFALFQRLQFIYGLVLN